MTTPSPVCCPGCRAHVHPVRPGLLARASVPFAWLYCAAMVLGGGLLGPFLFVLTPFLMIAGASMVRTAHDAAFHEPFCPRCQKILLDPPPQTSSFAAEVVEHGG